MNSTGNTHKNTNVEQIKITIMVWKILTGTAKEVESELNKLEKEWYVCMMGVSTTNEQTTVVVQLTGMK